LRRISAGAGTRSEHSRFQRHFAFTESHLQNRWMPVEMVTRILRDDGDKGTIIYGYKFRPVIVPRASVDAKSASV